MNDKMFDLLNTHIGDEYFVNWIHNIIKSKYPNLKYDNIEYRWVSKNRINILIKILHQNIKHMVILLENNNLYLYDNVNVVEYKISVLLRQFKLESIYN